MAANSPLKWVGGKQTVLNKIIPYIGNPKTFVEPFIGSATVSLNVSANNFIINDMNRDLINFYSHIISDRDKFIDLSLSHFDNMTKDKYYSLRQEFNNAEPDSIERAALFLVMNKFAFNGVCRYNSKGLFNVPWNQITKVGYPFKEVCYLSEHFNKNDCAFFVGDFSDPNLYKGLKEGDVVYFDPPYLPSNEFDGNFTSYTKENFSVSDHHKIVDISKKLRDNGVVCLISNHKTAYTEKLYEDSDNIVDIPKKRLVAANKGKRMQITEILAVYGKDKPQLSGSLFDD